MTENEPRWKKEARGLFFLLVILSAIPGLLSAYFDISAHKAGAKMPTAEKTVENIQHGNKKYITLEEAEQIRMMWWIFLVGFPSSILLGFVMRFVLKVDIFKQEQLPAWVENLKENVRKNSYENDRS